MAARCDAVRLDSYIRVRFSVKGTTVFDCGTKSGAGGRQPAPEGSAPSNPRPLIDRIVGRVGENRQFAVSGES